MGILRADRITGLGGANAIKGSTKFSDNRMLEVHPAGAESNEDFRLSNGSFTIEFWAYIADTSNSSFVGLFENNPARRSWMFEARADQALRFEWWTDGSSGTALTASTGSFSRDRWHHFAVVRNGTALNIYVDGTSVANATTSDTLYENTIEPLTIGGIFQSGAITQEVTGFISNLRIIKGEAIYTANFTPPTSELTVTSNTVVLACQSPGNVFKEATGKTIVATTTSTNDAPPQASHFTPNSPVGFSTTTDVGSQYGSTFDGFGNFATSTYMVPPGGNTRERNRGRGLIGQGNNTTSPYNVKAISYIEIQSGGTSFDFGDSTNGSMYAMTAVSSSTRAVFAGGHTTQVSPYGNTNLMEFVTISTTSNCTDFGDLNVAAANRVGASNQTRGLIAAGFSPNTRNIDKIEIATLGDATDYGDLSNQGFYGLNSGGMVSSTTRGLYAGGSGNSAPVAVNTIEFVLFSASSNGTDFGDLTHTNAYFNTGNSNGTRGIFMGGSDIDSPYPATDQIDFVTIASEGNATDFGSLNTSRYNAMGASNSTRGVVAGGRINPAPTAAATNHMEYVTISTTGNGLDFGELIEPEKAGAGCSDSHGGL